MRTRRYLPFILTLLASAHSSAQTPVAQRSTINRHNLMPVPASITFSTGRLPVSNSFSVSIRGTVDQRLKAGIDRALRRIERRTVMEIPSKLTSEADASLVIEAAGPGKLIPAIDEDESYSLNVTDKQALLKAPTVVGALRGLETFLQLLESDRDGYFIPAVRIDDRPRFHWRGLLIDVGRHYQPLEVLKRNLDAMAAVKLNVLHWHLTEDQGFRIESKKFPRLHEMGSDGLFYTQDEAREIISYARERGIRVIPEFDMPGHATSWLVGHPELGSAPGPYSIERKPGIFEPALDPTREEVYKFLDTFIGEMAALFPDAYMHIGGDENEGKQWDRNPRIQDFMRTKGLKDNHALQGYFNKRVLQILKKHGKIMMGWDEIFQPELPKEVVIHSWRGPDALAEAARRGYKGILSAGYYIDLIFPASQHYVVDPIPFDSKLTEAEAANVLGGEATMWSEWVSEETLDSRIWPRTAAIAERLWSPQAITNVDDMYRRLAVTSIQLEELGLMHKKNQAMLLRRLANGQDTEALQTLVSIIEPVKQYRRYQQRPQTMLSPLTGLIDASYPDSDEARRFTAVVDALLSDAPHFKAHAEQARSILTRWHNAGPELEVIIDGSPALHEAKPLATELGELGTTGLEALSYIAAGVPPSTKWRDDHLKFLDQASQPKAALEFSVIATLRQLVVAASELSLLKQMTPAEWRAQVKALAAMPAKPPGD